MCSCCRTPRPPAPRGRQRSRGTSTGPPAQPGLRELLVRRDLLGQRGRRATPGPAGPRGRGGATGNALLSGTGAPDNPAGNPGDFYLDIATGVLFGRKAAGGWPATGISLAGPQGDTGPAGPPGLTGPQGPAGA